MTKPNTLDTLLERSDPMNGIQPRTQQVKAATLEGILRTQPPQQNGKRGSRRLKWASSLTGVAAAAVVAFALLPGGVADPPSAAAIELLSAGRSAASAQVITPSGSQRLYTKSVTTSMMNYYTENVPNNPAEWSESTLMFETWIAPDESYYDVRTPIGKPTFGPAAQRQRNGDSMSRTHSGSSPTGTRSVATRAKEIPSALLRPDIRILLRACGLVSKMRATCLRR